MRKGVRAWASQGVVYRCELGHFCFSFFLLYAGALKDVLLARCIYSWAGEDSAVCRGVGG